MNNNDLPWVVKTASRYGDINIIINQIYCFQYIDDSEVRHIPLDENGYMTCPPVKHPPLYIQQEIPDAYDQKLQLQIHPSIAGFPSHVRKVSSNTSF